MNRSFNINEALEACHGSYYLFLGVKIVVPLLCAMLTMTKSLDIEALV